jgi:hypothetical protein
VLLAVTLPMTPCKQLLSIFEAIRCLLLLSELIIQHTITLVSLWNAKQRSNC